MYFSSLVTNSTAMQDENTESASGKNTSKGVESGTVLLPLEDPYEFDGLESEEVVNQSYKHLKRSFPCIQSKSGGDGTNSKKKRVDDLFESVFPSDQSKVSSGSVTTEEKSRKEKLTNVFDEVFGVSEDIIEKQSVVSDGICSSDCLNKTCFASDSSVSIRLTREKISNMSSSALHQFLLSRLNIQEELGLDSQTSFVFDQKRFCHKAVRLLFGISKYMIETCIKEHLAGQIFHIHGNKGGLYSSQKRDFAISFIHNFAQIHAENLPDREVLRLPHYLNIKELFCYYKDNVALEIQVKERNFYDIMKHYFCDVSRLDVGLPRITFMPANTHPMCSECDQINTMKKTAKNESDLLYALSRKKQHLLKVRRQYLQFCYRREMAIRFPADYLHIGKFKFIGIVVSGPAQAGSTIGKSNPSNSCLKKWVVTIIGTRGVCAPCAS